MLKGYIWFDSYHRMNLSVVYLTGVDFFKKKILLHRDMSDPESLNIIIMFKH